MTDNRYLELADWVLRDAIRSTREDGEWEKEMDNFSLRSGEIRITPKLSKGIPIGFDTQGAGIQPKTKKAAVTPYNRIPGIATKTVNAHDIYLATPQHNNFGVELQSLATEKPDTRPQTKGKT
jgi:hypothetical protein